MKIDSIGASVYRIPVDVPVETSFGVLRDRAAVVLQVRDDEGCHGWGEVWCNFPQVGAEHRARLVIDTLAPLVVGKEWKSPDSCFAELSQKLAVLAIQCGEPGTIAQCIAGLDIAMWDLWCTRRGQPVWRALGGTRPEVAVYASGINPSQPQRIALERQIEGHRAFKLKVGFGRERDVANLHTLRDALGDGVSLMADANQAWDLKQAVSMSREMSRFNLMWLEEPMRADESVACWKALSHESPIPLAAGENLRGEHFDEMLDANVLSVIQPDVAKWGGFSQCLEVARKAAARGVMFCPHWLGGGIGLAASLHLKAAAGGSGFTEIDSNPNPLRETLQGASIPVHEGHVRLSEAPGLGIQPQLAAISNFQTWSGMARATESRT